MCNSYAKQHRLLPHSYSRNAIKKGDEMNQINKPFTLSIPLHYNETEAKELGIQNEDFTGLINKLEEYDTFLEVSGIYTTSCKTILTLLKETEIQYQTETTKNTCSAIHISDPDQFIRICSPNETTVHEAWLSVINKLSWDIDECIERYGCTDIGSFLKSLLVYITQFTITTK